MTDETDDNGHLIGYVRVSTADQSVTMQVDALKKAGVSELRIFSENASVSKVDRPKLKEAMHMANSGDTLVVWKLDRIARSMSHLHELLEGLESRKVRFRSISEGIETQTPAGRSILHVLGPLAQFERDLIRERSRTGVKAALLRGVKFGADFKLPEDQMPRVQRLIRQEGRKQVDVAREYNVTPNTIARRLKEYEANQAKAEKKRPSRKDTK